jgi:hypothetical protein
MATKKHPSKPPAAKSVARITFTRLDAEELALVDKIANYTGVKKPAEILRMGIRALAREYNLS